MAKTKKLLSIITAVVIAALTLVVCVPFIMAFAGEAPDAGGSDQGSQDEALFDKLYYYSDYEDCETYKDGIQSYVDTYKQQINPEFDNEIAFFDWSYTQDASFVDHVVEYYDNGAYFDIANSFIIFEMRQRLPTDVVCEQQGQALYYETHPYVLDGLDIRFVYDEKYIFVNMLRDMFCTFKENGCKIMVIFGTEEVCFTDGNEYVGNDSFMDYVDIQVDLDVFYMFFDNYLNQIEQACDFENCVMVLDSSMSSYWFLRQYLFPYIADRYGHLSDANEIENMYESDKIYAAQYNAMFILRRLNARIVVDEKLFERGCLADLTHNYEAMHGVIYTYEELCSDLMPINSTDKIFPLGSLSENGANFDMWTQCFDIFGRYGVWNDEYVYIYRGDADDTLKNNVYEKYEMGGYNVRTTSSYLSEIDTWLPRIIYDFIMGADLSVYDNYETYTLCPVVHKAMRASPGGWMEKTRALGSGKTVIRFDTFIDLYSGGIVLDGD